MKSGIAASRLVGVRVCATVVEPLFRPSRAWQFHQRLDGAFDQSPRVFPEPPPANQHADAGKVFSLPPAVYLTVAPVVAPEQFHARVEEREVVDYRLRALRLPRCMATRFCAAWARFASSLLKLSSVRAMPR